MQTSIAIEERHETTISAVPSPKTRNCHQCELPIPEARLKAQPNAVVCVPCLEISGDVPLVRRFDETSGEQITSTLYYHPNPYLETAIRRSNEFVPSNIEFEQAVGDDSFLERERGLGLGVDLVEYEAENRMIAAVDAARAVPEQPHI